MALNVAGLVSVIVFYLLILIIGIVAGRKTAKTGSRDEIILANRSMGVLVSFFTLTGTCPSLLSPVRVLLYSHRYVSFFTLTGTCPSLL